MSVRLAEAAADLCAQTGHGWEPHPLAEVLAQSAHTPGEALERIACADQLHLRLVWHSNATRGLLQRLSTCHSRYCDGEDRGIARERLEDGDHADGHKIG